MPRMKKPKTESASGEKTFKVPKVKQTRVTNSTNRPRNVKQPARLADYVLSGLKNSEIGPVELDKDDSNVSGKNPLQTFADKFAPCTSVLSSSLPACRKVLMSANTKRKGPGYAASNLSLASSNKINTSCTKDEVGGHTKKKMSTETTQCPAKLPAFANLTCKTSDPPATNLNGVITAVVHEQVSILRPRSF